MPGSKHKSRGEWKRIIANFELSGETQEVFCTKHNLRPGTFKQWYYRFRKKSNESNILPIQIASHDMHSKIGIILPNGSRLEFDQGLPVSYAANLIKEMNKC